jgi:hypothetical protein
MATLPTSMRSSTSTLSSNTYDTSTAGPRLTCRLSDRRPLPRRMRSRCFVEGARAAQLREEVRSTGGAAAAADAVEELLA